MYRNITAGDPCLRARRIKDDRSGHTSRARLLGSLVSGLLLIGCADTSGPDDERPVEIAAMARSSAATAGTPVPVNGNGELVLTGTNGVLTIQKIQLIVAQFELKRANRDDGECDRNRGQDSPCRRFESAPFLLDLPLMGSAVVVAAERVPFGTYSELRFEVEDLDGDDDDMPPWDRQVILDIRTQLRALYPGIGDETSMIVKGTFTPVAGQSRPFTAFVDAEIEIERRLDPPLVVDGSGANRRLTLEIDPARWFRRGGQVIDLSVLNGTVLEFEVEIEDGFSRIEWN